MKKSFVFLVGLLLVASVAMAQENQEPKVRKLPPVDVKTLDGKTVNTSEFSNLVADPKRGDSTFGKPIILSFWATWCKPCITELTTISDVYPDWQEETGVKLIAISIDDSRTSAGVKPFVDGKGWEYEVYLDANGDFKRAMNVNLVPHTFVLNGNGEIVWQHTSFSQGAELGLIDVIRKIIAGQPVPQE